MKEITKSERKRIIAGIAEYKHEQEVIKRVLRKHTRISTTEFDRIFGDNRIKIDTKTGISHQVRPRPKFRFLGSRGETFIIGDIFSVAQWSKGVELIQFMCILGIVHLEEKEMYYSLKEKGGD